MSTVAGNAADIASLNAIVSSLITNTHTHYEDDNSFYLLVVGVFVFFMQAGFALLEAGSVRAKNTKNILMKNLLDACIGALIWWGWGYGLAYNGDATKNGFIGNGDPEGPAFFANGWNKVDQGFMYASWWFQFVFCAATATIVSGAMAERTSLIGYFIYTICITGFIYPVVVKWSWGYGWAYQFSGGLMDFAGSGIVHMTGGVAALTGAAIVGPRKGRFDESKKPVPMPPHNTTFQVLGTFILWMGWYGFKPGSTLKLAGNSGTATVGSFASSYTGYGQDMARAVVTTTLAGATGGLTVVFVDKLAISKIFDIGMLCNGILAGLDSITAGAADVYPWAAVIIGFLGGFVYLAGSKTVLYICKVDDPLDAFAVHGCCGFWGVVATALFCTDALRGTGDGAKDGLFYGGGKPLGAAMAFLWADIAWTGGMSVLMFLPLKMAGLLRVSAEVEDAGMDVSKHGGSAYVS